MQESMELFRSNAGGELRSNRLTLNEDGSIVMDTQDIGSTADEMFGEREYEFALTIPAQALPRLAFLLLAERFQGQPDAVDRLRGLCRGEGVPHSFSNR